MCVCNLHRDVSDGVVGTLGLVCGGDEEWSNAPGPDIVRAVPLSRHATPLLLTESEKDDTGSSLLPDHLPEVYHRVREWDWGMCE